MFQNPLRIQTIQFICYILTTFSYTHKNIYSKALAMVLTPIKSQSIVVPKADDKLQFGLGKIAFSLLPLSPESSGRRKTIKKEIVKDTIWTLDQIQGIINVNGMHEINLDYSATYIG